MSRTRLSLAALAAACLALPAGVAQADSIVYVDGGNVWSASPDGAHKVQLTDGGDWHSPTQADDGTIAAVQGTGPIQVLAADGRPLRTITTPPAESSNGGDFAPRPVNLSFSPDGSKIAYSYYASSCPVASTCDTTQSTFYTHANVTEATPVATYGNQFNVGDAEWVTNSRTLVFGGAGSQVSIDDLGPGDYSHTPWMTPNADQGDGEVSRDGKRLVTTFFYGDDTVLAFFPVKGDVKTEIPEDTDAACASGADGQIADPTWSPDGTGIAMQSKEGIEVGRFTKFEDTVCETSAFTVLTPTGSTPDWGPASPPAKRWAPPVVGNDDAPAAGALRLAATPKATARALRRGLVAQVAVPGAGPVHAKLVAKNRTIARGTATATGAGTVKVRLSKVSKRVGRRVTLVVTHGASTVRAGLKVR